MFKHLLFAVTALLVMSTQLQAKTAADIPLEEFFKTYYVGGISFSPDETEIVFVSDKSGLYQPYITSVRDGKWRRLVKTKDAVYGITWCPTDRDKIFFMMDKDGDENWHIYVTYPGNDEELEIYTDITPWEGKRSTFLGWSHNGKYLYYNSNKRDDRFMDTYRLDVETMEHEVVFENNTTFSVNGISPDDKTLILHEFLNVTASNLYVYDIESEEMKPFATQEDGEAGYRFADFSPDGRYYYVISDKDAEFDYLTKYDTKTGEWEKVLEANWDVTKAGFSHNNSYFFTSINEGGLSKVEITIVKTGEKLLLPPLPPAEIIPVGFSRSERYLRIVVNADNIPGDQYLYDIQENELIKLTDLFDNSELESEMLVESELIHYESFDGKQIPAFIYKPKDIPKNRKLPIVIDVHGGPMAQSAPGYSAWTQFLVSRGFIVAVPNVRGSTGYGKSYYLADDHKWGEDPLYDVVYLKKYLGNDPQADTSQTVIWGGSYGGYMVLAAMTFAPEEFALGLDWVGPSNLFTLMSSIPPYWEPYRNYFYTEIGNPE
ncbi:prolyl oligopeptidase family serine peptidase, partial [bacterium]|nr:prolyl oligopeptidase family serine peptidase [bacterium]